MKIIRTIIVGVAVLLVLFGMVYNIFVTPFSSMKFDLIAWGAIGIACLFLIVIGRKK